MHNVEVQRKAFRAAVCVVTEQQEYNQALY